MIDERIGKQTRERRRKVEVPGLDPPVLRLLVDDVVDEACEFGPEGPALPEERVDGDRESKTNGSAEEAGGNNAAEGKADVGLEVRVDGVAGKQDGYFRAEDNTSNGEEDECGLAAAFA